MFLFIDPQLVADVPLTAIGTHAEPAPDARELLHLLMMDGLGYIAHTLNSMARLSYLGQPLTAEILRTCLRRHLGRTEATKLLDRLQPQTA